MFDLGEVAAIMEKAVILNFMFCLSAILKDYIQMDIYIKFGAWFMATHILSLCFKMVNFYNWWPFSILAAILDFVINTSKT